MINVMGGGQGHLSDSPVPGHRRWSRTVNQNPCSDHTTSQVFVKRRVDQGSVLCLIFISHKSFLTFADFLLIIPFYKFGTLDSDLFDDCKLSASVNNYASVGLEW